VTTQPAPIVDLTLSGAIEELTGFDVIAIETHFKRDFQDLGGFKTLLGAVWVYGNRDGRKMEWQAVKSMTLKQLNGYFVPEPTEAVEGESEVGKGS
jgi:hypothetical protein